MEARSYEGQERIVHILLQLMCFKKRSILGVDLRQILVQTLQPQKLKDISNILVYTIERGDSFPV